MKSLITLLLLSVQLCAFTLVLNSGKEQQSEYAILHIMDTEPFMCETIPDAFEKKRYLCKAKLPFNKPVETKKMKLAELSFYTKEGDFYLAVEPKVDSYLKPVEDKLHQATELLKAPNKVRYAHWIIVLQEKELYPEKEPVEGIDFPVVFPKYQKPYIGALDLNGAPISYAQSKDIDLYLEIKRAYERGKNEGVIEDGTKVLAAFPNSIFRSEIELYMMRSMDRILSTSEDEGSDATNAQLLSMAKAWSKEFTSDENLPEVLMLMTKAAFKAGSKADGNYFIDILVTEHSQSPYTKKAILFFADELYKTREKEKAIKLYQEVLYSVQDLDIASEAAIRLSDSQLDAGRKKEAQEYLLKVLGVNAAYLLKEPDATLRLAKRLYEHKLYDNAAQLADVLLEGVPKSYESYEALIKLSGDWHAKANHVEKAYARYQRYLSEYASSGEYVEEVKEALDELFFKRPEGNESTLLAYYERLSDEYTNAIGEKARLEKAKLLMGQKAYDKVLEMEEGLRALGSGYGSEPETLLYEAAMALALQSLEKDACQEVVEKVERYKLHITDPSHEVKLFHCLMRLARYERAQDISMPHLKDKNLSSRYAWLQREIAVRFHKGDNTGVMALQGDVEQLSASLKEPLALETLRYLVLVHVRAKGYEQVLALSKRAEELYANTLPLIDLFDEVVKMANERKDNLLLISYANKMMALQERFNSHLLTPRIHFLAIEAYKRLGKMDEALGVVQTLEKQTLEPAQKIRLLYNAGELSLGLKKEAEAKRYFEQCVEINATSSWKGICEENLKLF